MMENRLREKIRKGEYSVGTRVHSRWPFMTELVGASGKYDYVEFLAEWTPYELEDMENICLAAERYHMGTTIKLDFQNRAYVAQKAIGAGFQGVLLTDHKTAEEVRDSIRVVRPDTIEDMGRFGRMRRRFSLSGGGFLNLADYLEKLRDIVVIVMIEKREAVENLDEILSVPGIDLIQWGPNDYATSMGWEVKDKKQELSDIEQRIIETARRRGIDPRGEFLDVAQADSYLAQGFKHFCVGDEINNAMKCWNESGSAMRDKIAASRGAK